MFRRKWLLVLLALIVIGGGAAAYFARQRVEGARVTTETVQKRDLEAIVSASGKIDPKKTVNISAQSMGRVTQLAVNEGDRVRQGQFLLQIDPVNAESAVRRDEAGVAARANGPRAVAGPAQELTGQSRSRAQGSETPAGALAGGPDDAGSAGEGAGGGRRARGRTSTPASRRSRRAKSRRDSRRPG